MSLKVIAVDRPEIPAFDMSDRFRHDVAYFMSPAGNKGVPHLQPGEYWIDPEQAAIWLDEGVFRLVSPLDSQSQAEVEITEEQEAWLEWMVHNKIDRIRLQ